MVKVKAAAAVVDMPPPSVHLSNVLLTKNGRSIRFTMQLGEGEYASSIKGCLATIMKDGTFRARPWQGCLRCQRYQSISWEPGLERQVLVALEAAGWFEKLRKAKAAIVDVDWLEEGES